MCESLKNKVALVTASTRGIGLAIVKISLKKEQLYIWLPVVLNMQMNLLQV